MRSKTLPVLTLTLLSIIMTSSVRAAAPTFEALGSGYRGELAVVGPGSLLTVVTPIKPDPGIATALPYYTGLARDPLSGKIFFVAVGYQESVFKSFLGEVDFTAGVERTVGTITGERVNDIAFDGTGHLYGVTNNGVGNTPHALLAIDTATAVVTVVKILDSHGATSGGDQTGAIAWNPADGSLYYADQGRDGRVFVDKLASNTFAQTYILTAELNSPVAAIAFTAEKLWLSPSFGLYSADASNLAGGFTYEGYPAFPTVEGGSAFLIAGMFPTTLSCIPSTTAACLYNRFKVEVTYDATPQNGSGSGNVVLESGQSVKFTFFDSGNIELIVKVLSACTPPFNKWWVFAGGLTNVGVSIKVTDTATGAMKTYSSEKGKLFQPVADTAAFACP